MNDCRPVVRAFAIAVALAGMVRASESTKSQPQAKAIKLFVLAGDENILDQGLIEGPQAKEGTSDYARSLAWVVSRNPAFHFLKDNAGEWVRRDDVVLYDLHPLLNNTKTVGHPLQVGDVAYGGKARRGAFGADLMFGHVMGDHFEEPVLIVRFATYHPIWFERGSRSLGKDYLSPSAGGNPNAEGSWDVIHFNWGVWDATYKDKASKYYQGHGSTTTVADYEKNLRTLVARMKRTGATLIFSNTTPVWKGELGKPNADVKAFNAVAKRVMEENGVVYEDLHAEVLRQGAGTTQNVHDVGNLAPHVIKTIEEALAARTNSTKPFPRVLLIGDSITGTYQEQVTNQLDGKALVYKNPGNGESTWTGLQRIDEWLDLKNYLLCGQEYHELVDGLRRIVADPPTAVAGHQGRGVEIAGLVWFQGILDSRSTSMAGDYEKNLVNFIKDIRADLAVPNLPVVVMALSSKSQRPEGNVATVYQAQLGVGDTKKHPEFAGTVATIEYEKAKRDIKGLALGNDASAYLEVGKAMAQAMLKLMENPRADASPTAMP